MTRPTGRGSFQPQGHLARLRRQSAKRGRTSAKRACARALGNARNGFASESPPPRRLLHKSSDGGGSLRDFATAARRPPWCTPAQTDSLARARARAGEAELVHSVAMHAAVLRPRALVGPCSTFSRSGKRTNNRDGAAVMMSSEPPGPPATSNPFEGRACPAVASLAGRASRSVRPHALRLSVIGHRRRRARSRRGRRGGLCAKPLARHVSRIPACS